MTDFQWNDEELENRRPADARCRPWRSIAALRRRGRVVVFTNGVFDLLHPGHVRYLQAARALGRRADRRPQRRQLGAARTRVPSGRSRRRTNAPKSWRRSTCVDAVVLLRRRHAGDDLSALQPDILVKGADWPADQIVGRDTVEARGGRVVRIPVEQGYSTSAILEKIRSSRMQDR